MSTLPPPRKVAPGGYRTADKPIAPDRAPGAPRQPDGTPPPAPPSERPGKIAKWVTRQYLRCGELLKPFDPVCGGAVVSAAEAAGMAWERLARENKTVRDVINRLMQTTVTTELLMAHVPILLAVLTHHVPAFRELVQKSSMAFIRTFAETMPDLDLGDEAAA